MADNPADTHQMRYTLSFGLTATKSPTGPWKLDLGCCVMRWGW